MQPTRCHACGGSRIGVLGRLYEYLSTRHEDERGDSGVWISFLPRAGSRFVRKIQAMVGGGEIGELSAVICADCGYVELYVKDSQQVPWDKDRDFVYLSDERPCGRCGGQRTGQMGTVGPHLAFVEKPWPWYLFFLPRVVEPVGPVTGIVCTVCGYLETHVQNPGKIPWDRLERFERLERGHGGRCRACGSSVRGNLSSAGEENASLALYKVRWYQEGVGRLRAVVCLECGHFDVFVRDVEKLEWSGLPHFEWLG